MTRIKNLKIETAQGPAKELLQGVKAAMGAEINIFGMFANAPAALDGYLKLNGALAGGVLNKQLREQIALAVAGKNGCDYCASAHTYLGKHAGIDEAELGRNLEGHSTDAKTQAGLSFALAVLNNKGRVSDAQFNAARDAGFSDAELVEIVAHVAMNTFTNMFNETFKTEIDFPVVSTSASKVA